MNAATAASIGKGPRNNNNNNNNIGHKRRKRRRMLTGVSRQRRAANARERRRVQGITDAFLELRSILPVLKRDDVSKMDTLRLAAKWIAHLTTVLIREERDRDSSDTDSQSLPNTVKDKFHELSNFEIEDFDLVDRADYVEDEDSDSSGDSDKHSVGGLQDLTMCSPSHDINNPSWMSAARGGTEQQLLLQYSDTTDTASDDILFRITNSLPGHNPRHVQDDTVSRFSENCDWMSFISTSCCQV